MNEATQYIFYPGKRHVIHLAINIACAPLLLYILGLWAWPPILPHYIVFAITTIIAIRYSRKRMVTPRLVIDDSGLHFDRHYPAENIYKAQPSYRSVTLTWLGDGQVQTKTLALGWASNDDCKAIQQLLVERFQREPEPPENSSSD